MTDRRRNSVILLLVLILVGLAAVTIVVKKTRLGLDLKGGVELVYEAKPTSQAKVDSESINRAIDIIRKRVDQLGVSSPEIQRSGEKEIVASLPEIKDPGRAEREVGSTAQLIFYDWEPNVIGASGEPAPTEQGVTGGREAGAAAFGLSEFRAVQRAAKRKAILRPSDTTWVKGCTEAQVNGCLYGSWYLLDTKNDRVLCPGNSPPETCPAAETQKALYAGTKIPPGAKAEAVRVNPGTVVVRARATESTSGKVINKTPNRFYVLNDDPVLLGVDVTHPQQGFDEQGSGQPNVNFGFTGHGKAVFEAVTKKIAHRGQEAQLPGVPPESALQHFAVVLDGQLITAPSIDYRKYPEGIDAATGSQISGGFTIGSAQELAEELQQGALPIKLVLVSRHQVSATLGKQALSEGLLAGLAGFIVVCFFLLVFYRVLGLIAVGGLIIYGIYFFALIKLIPITLTLPGIAGLILTIGVAADANIVIFERVKEEIRGGRSVLSGIATGYKRGFAAIVDANVVTFMTAFILFALATAEVKGFAFTLGIGTLVSLFTAVLATQAALGAMGRSRFVTHPSALGAGRERKGWSFDFMGASKWFFSLSGTILLVGALAIGGKGLNLGIDFKSGTRIQTAFVKQVNEAQVAEEMSTLGYPTAKVQRFSNGGVGGQGYQISLKTLTPGGVKQVEQALNTKFQNKSFSSNSIGPTFGKTIAKSAVIAIIASLLVISAYIALRFEWKYAVPVLIALMHDLLITAGVYSLTGREVTTATVAALLTILGYSLYDTIIVFDRVRENVPRMPRAAFSQIVNRSMAEVLTRSLATTFCTLLPVLALLLFGGETLRDFAFALMIGIASGAYSSIFIASPVLTHWKEREPGYRSRRHRLVRELGAVPAYATTLAGAPEEVEPETKRGKRRSGRLTQPEEPGEQLSRDEFRELVEDIKEDTEPVRSQGIEPAGAEQPRARVAKAVGARKGRTAAATVEPQPATPPAQEDVAPPERDPAADLTPEDLVLKDAPKPRAKARRQKSRRHGRSR
ncbi:MAG: protein translocase subunit SecD [Solirubrobacteraceae bacterium]